MKKKDGIDTKFIRNCESVFDADFNVEQETEDQYEGMVVNPFYERELVEAFERGVEYAD